MGTLSYDAVFQEKKEYFYPYIFLTTPFTFFQPHKYFSSQIFISAIGIKITKNALKYSSSFKLIPRS